MYYELQPLRIQAGWKIQYNNFTEYDINIHNKQDSFELHEDLLQLHNEKANLIIDLGWYPSYDINGNYILQLVKNFDWNCPLEQISSTSKNEIIAYIEKWVCYHFFQNIAAHNGTICLYKNHILHTKPLSLNLYSFNKRGALKHDNFFLLFLQCNIKNNTQTQIYLLIIIWSYNSFRSEERRVGKECL